MFTSDANKRIEVVSYLEAALVFCIFAFILYVLYPKDMLEKQVLSESKNYDLTAIYLENMLRLEPENKTLTIALIESSIKSGKFDLALKMIDILEAGSFDILAETLISYRFEALKTKYFSSNEKKFQQETISELHTLLNEVIEDKHYMPETLEYWYKGAREFSINKQALFFLFKLLEAEETSLWLKECFYLSADIKDTKMQESCLKRLRQIDASHYNEWTQTAYYLAVEAGEIDQAIALLKDMASKSVKWRIELAKFYVELKYYKKGSSEYMVLHKISRSASDKKKYLLKALESLQYGALMDEAAALARKYEALYYRDKEMSGAFIKLYLAGNKLEDAKRVSIKRLKYIK